MDIKIILSVFLLIFIVSGCGSDSDDEAEESTCSESLSCPSGGTLGGFIEWISGACTTNTVCSADPDTFDDPGIVGPSLWESGEREESEPNNNMQEALLVFVEDPGLANIIGTISASDIVDYVGFSTAYDKTITIYICESPSGSFGCVTPGPYSGDDVYLDILDVNGNTIASTAISLGPSGHEILMTFTPMQVYFVRVVKDNLTSGGLFQYRLIILNGLRT